MNPQDGVFDDVHLPMLCSVSMRDDNNKPIYTIEKHNIIVYKCVDCVLYCNISTIGRVSLHLMGKNNSG